MMFVRHPHCHQDFEHFTKEFQSELLNRFNQLQKIAEALNDINSGCLNFIFDDIYRNIQEKIREYGRWPHEQNRA